MALRAAALRSAAGRSSVACSFMILPPGAAPAMVAGSPVLTPPPMRVLEARMTAEGGRAMAISFRHRHMPARD